MTEKSGLNMDTLYLDDDAAHDVAEEFRKAGAQIEDLRQTILSFFTDLGMGDCQEGKTWNDKVSDIVNKNPGGSVLSIVETCLKRFGDFAHQADLAQTEFDEMEKKNKAAIDQRAQYMGKPDPSKSFPPFQ